MVRETDKAKQEDRTPIRDTTTKKGGERDTDNNKAGQATYTQTQSNEERRVFVFLALLL